MYHFGRFFIVLIAGLFGSIQNLAGQGQTPETCGWSALYGPGGIQYNKRKEVENHNVGIDKLIVEPGKVYTLPVVVHIMHTGGAPGTAYNPTDAQVQATLALLNQAWRRQGSNYGGVDMEIQFALAKKGPNCEPATGINRVNASGVADYSTGGIAIGNFGGSASERTVKGLSRWPNADYINIWIVNKINGSEFFPGGFAYLPELNSALDDGITLLAGTIDGTNQTIVHEMGHYFNLLHTFADGGWEDSCPANASCQQDGDKVCDTEPCKNMPCGTVTNLCTGQPFVIADAAKQFTVLHNHMGYGTCAAMFTAGQKDRCRDALNRFRGGLVSSSALQNANTGLPAMACAVNTVHGLSPYFGVQKLELNTYSVYSNTSGADGAHYVDRTCNQRFTVTANRKFFIKVTGSYENWHAIKAFIDANNDGDFNDAGELLLSGYGGQLSDSVLLPAHTLTNTPLRLRIVADHPELPAAGACQLTGILAEGAGQAEDFTLIAVPARLESVKSGNWNDPATWDAGRVPANTDNVLIKTGHTIVFTTAMGAGRCLSLTLEPNSYFNQVGDFRVGL